jgi:hypothetical protein
VSYQRLVSSGRTIEDVAAALGKSKGYVYQRISLTRLVPKVQDLLARDVLPLVYALKIAVVPAEQQEEALAQCFRPLFRDEEARRDQLEPLAQLTAWVEKTVRLNPKSEDSNVLLPALVEQVVSAEQERDASVLALSTLHFHTDRTDPKPILAKSWKPADGKGRCPHARPGVIVLGEGQGTFLQVCVAKKECQKHWARPKATNSASREDDGQQTEARKQQEEAWAKQRAEAERWRTELRPRAVRVIADRTAKLGWSPMLLRLLLEDIRPDELFLDIVGKPVMHLQQQYLAVQAKLDRGYDDRLADRITDELWQRKSGEWEAELASIRRETARHEKASHDYGATGSKILELAKNAHNLFVLQDSHEQARLLKMLVSNSTFDRGSLSVSYIKPFDLLVDGNETGNWLGGRDSNHR